MANLARVRTTWSGSPVTGGGVSTFYFAETHSGFVADLNAFWTAVKNILYTGITLTTDNTGDLVDVETGALSGTWTDGSTSIVTTGATGVYAAGVGARVRWSTNGITRKRRVRGSTFIVPLGSTGYDAQGSLDTATITTLSTACTSLFTGSEGNMRIYTRPVSGVGGKASAVTGFTIPDRVSWLRTRRT